MATTTTTQTKAPASGQLILAAVLAIFVYGVIAAMLGTIMPTYTDLTGEQKGTIALAQAIGLIIASVSAGPLIDNRGKKIALLLALALICIGLFALPSVAGSYPQRVMMFLVLGVGGGILVTAANSLVSDISEERRATTLNFLNLFFGLGGLATPFLAANLLGGDAVKILYVGGALATITLIVNAVTPMPPPSGERGFKLGEVGMIFSRPALYLLSAFLFLYVACEVGVWNWLATYLETQGIAKSSALNILSLGFALGILVGRVIVSRIVMRVPAPTVTLGSSILMAGTTYWMLQAKDATTAGIAVFLAGVAMAPVFPTTLAMVGDAFPRATATAMGLVITFGWVGLAASSPLIGSIAGSNSENLKTALLVIPVASVIMVLINLVMRGFVGKPKLAAARS